MRRYQFLIDTYETERVKVLSVWSLFHDEDLPMRPHPTDPRGRSVREQMVHQCLSEDNWFKGMLGIDIAAPALPQDEIRGEFVACYAASSARRLLALREKDDSWWEQEVRFFDVRRSRAWIMVRRVAHTAHHRGQHMAMLRMMGRDVYSTYGPTADTGGLAQNGGRVIYAYADEQALLSGGPTAALPGLGEKPPGERGPL